MHSSVGCHYVENWDCFDCAGCSFWQSHTRQPTVSAPQARRCLPEKTSGPFSCTCTYLWSHPEVILPCRSFSFPLIASFKTYQIAGVCQQPSVQHRAARWLPSGRDMNIPSHHGRAACLPLLISSKDTRLVSFPVHPSSLCASFDLAFVLPLIMRVFLLMSARWFTT